MGRKKLALALVVRMWAGRLQRSGALSAVLAAGSLLAVSGCSDPELGEDANTSFQQELGSSRILVDSLGQRLSPVSVEVVEANRGPEAQLNLIARIQTQPGVLFEIYEPQPGYPLYAGGGSPESGVLVKSSGPIDSKSSVAQVWEVVSQGKPMPATVAAAAKREAVRWQAAGVVPSERAVVLSNGGEEPYVQPIGGGFCDTDYFTENSPGYGAVPGACLSDYDQRVCLNDVEDGTHSAFNNDMMVGITNTCAAEGTVTLSVKYRTTESSWTVPQNTWRFSRRSDPTCVAPWEDCPYFRSRVENASGDRYHFRFLVETG